MSLDLEGNGKNGCDRMKFAIKYNLYLMTYVSFEIKMMN